MGGWVVFVAFRIHGLGLVSFAFRMYGRGPKSFGVPSTGVYLHKPSPSTELTSNCEFFRNLSHIVSLLPGLLRLDASGVFGVRFWVVGASRFRIMEHQRNGNWKWGLQATDMFIGTAFYMLCYGCIRATIGQYS